MSTNDLSTPFSLPPLPGSRQPRPCSFQPTLHTPRLTLTLFDGESESDYASTLSVLNDASLIAQMGVIGINTVPQLANLRYSTSLPARWTPLNQQPTTASVWNIRLGPNNMTGQVIGFINVSCRHEQFPPDFGWVLLPVHQGHGYASEAAKRVQDYFVHEFQGGFINADPKIPLVACIKAKNEVSEKLARRLRLRESGWVQYEGEDKHVVHVWAVEGLGCKTWAGDVRPKWGGWRSSPTGMLEEEQPGGQDAKVVDSVPMTKN